MTDAVNTNFETAYKTTENKTASNGLMWFVSLLPAFGLFLERYAVNALVGIVLWAVIIIISPVVCFIDCKTLEKSGVDVSSAKKFILLPPVYVFKRELIFHHDPNKGVMLGIFIITALIFNGFTQSMGITAEKMEQMVQNTYVSNLDNFNVSTQNVIGEQIEKYFGKSGSWSNSKTEGGYSVVYSAEKDGKKYVISFNVQHDGFCYQGFKIDNITVNDKRPDDDNYKKLLGDIFIPEANDNEK